MSPRRVTLDGAVQAYREHGDGPAVVLLHGISSGSASWEPLAGRLPGHHLLAWDAPGYGDSTPLAEGRPMARDYAARLAAWLEALAVERVVLVGHSLGALMAAAYGAMHPGRLAGLVLADPAQGYRHADDAKRDAVYRSRWTQLAEQGHAAYAEERAPRLLRDNARAEDLARVKAGMRRLDVDGFARASWMLANDSLTDNLDAPLGVPTRVLCGAEDRITPPADARSLATRLGVTYHELPGAGHASYIDAPQAFAADVAEFIAGLDWAEFRSPVRTP